MTAMSVATDAIATMFVVMRPVLHLPASAIARIATAIRTTRSVSAVVADTVTIRIDIAPTIGTAALCVLTRTVTLCHAVITQAVVTDAVAISVDVCVARAVVLCGIVLVPSRTATHRAVRIVRVVRCDVVHVPVSVR